MSSFSERIKSVAERAVGHSDRLATEEATKTSLVMPLIQALGYGHCEEMAYDEDGRMVNATFGPYKIYRSDEMPRIEAFLVQTMEKSGPFGAKAVAEIPKDGVAPAIRNALADATGVRIDAIPLTPERVWRALQTVAK